MKICYISVATFPSRTAHTSYTSNLARALARNCDHVQVIGWEGPGRDPCVDEAIATDNLTYLLLRGPSASASRRVWAMGFATVRHAPMWSARVDRVITHSPVVAAALRTRKIPFVLDVHGTSERGRITRYAISGNVARGCIFNSQQMLAICQKAWNVEHLPGLVLGSGINYAQLTNLPPRSLALAESGISPDRMVIGYIGSLGPGRGIDLLLNAALAMQAQHPSLVWLFVGGNPDDVAKWQAYAVDLGLPPNCFCFVGHQQQDSLARFYSLADILVAPYSRLIKDANTMAPMKLVEYLAVGKPIIASDLPTLRTALGQFDRIGAAFFAPDSQNAFISALEGILERAAEFASWGEKMRVSAASMSWDAKASVLLDWLKTLKP